jgi:hypothetical protein
VETNRRNAQLHQLVRKLSAPRPPVIHVQEEAKTSSPRSAVRVDKSDHPWKKPGKKAPGIR